MAKNERNHAENSLSPPPPPAASAGPPLFTRPESSTKQVASSSSGAAAAATTMAQPELTAEEQEEDAQLDQLGSLLAGMKGAAAWGCHDTYVCVWGWVDELIVICI